MKKLLCVILCLGLVFCFAACRGNNGEQPDGGTVSKTEKGDLDDTVKLVLPIEYVEEEYRDNLDAYCEAYGYKSAKLNKRDNTVTIEMREMSYDLLLTEIGIKVLKEIYAVADSEDYPYIKEVSSVDTKEFRGVTITVDRKGYEKAGSLGPYVIGQSCLLYQFYQQPDEYKCSVTVIDGDTNEIIETKTYTDKE